MKSVLFRLVDLAAGSFDFVSQSCRKVAGGLRFVGYRLFLHQNRDDDIWVATYPKSGTTVSQMLLHQLASKGDTSFRHIEDVAPWFEIILANDPAYLNRLPSPRIFKTHLRPGQLPANGRVIYVLRNPKDVVVSFFHQLSGMYEFEGDLNRFAERFVEGRVPYGGWFEHLEAWLKRREGGRFLLLNYDEFRQDLPGVAKKIAEFCQFELTESEMAEAVENASFQSMRAMNEKFDPRRAQRGKMKQRQGSSDFIRKGKVAGWVNELSEEAEGLIDQRLEQLSQSTGLGEILAAADRDLRDEIDLDLAKLEPEFLFEDGQLHGAVVPRTGPIGAASDTLRVRLRLGDEAPIRVTCRVAEAASSTSDAPLCELRFVDLGASDRPRLERFARPA